MNGGPGGRVYWFYFFKMPHRAYGDEIPKFTQEDQERVLAQKQDDPITPNLTFKDVLDRKISSVLVPLEEHVFRKWYFKRIITIGDAAHKARIIDSGRTYNTGSLLTMRSFTQSQVMVLMPVSSRQRPWSTSSGVL